MAEVKPVVQPRAVKLPQATDFRDLYRLIIKVREHLNQFNEEWASHQPDYQPTMGYLEFSAHRRLAVATDYRGAIRIQTMVLWKPEIAKPPPENEHPERDIFEVVLPWIMSVIEAEPSHNLSLSHLLNPFNGIALVARALDAPIAPAAEKTKDKQAPLDSAAIIQLTVRQQLILQGLLGLQAIDSDSRKTTPEIAIAAEGTSVDPQLFKHPLADLARKGLVCSKEGRGGGFWLTPDGKSRAEHLDKL